MVELQIAAKGFHSFIEEPAVETTPDQISETASNALNHARTALRTIATRDPQEATFLNTVQALDSIQWEYGNTIGRLALLREASTNTALRDAASQALRMMASSPPDADYEAEIYRATKAVDRAHPKLSNEDARLLQRALIAGRRSGADLSEDKRQQLINLQRQIDLDSLEFMSNLRKPAPKLRFNRAELQGVPNWFLRRNRVKGTNDEYLVQADTYEILDAHREETRRRLWIASSNRAAEQNTPLLQRILECRTAAARLLGYPCWEDYISKGRMVGTSSVAVAFCEELSLRLNPKFDADLEELAKLKARDTGNPGARIEWWDLGYYSKRRKKSREPDLRYYFPSYHVLSGIFKVCERVFGIRIDQVEPHSRWSDGLQLYSVSDATSGEPLGLIYFDPYQSDGKQNGASTRTIISGGQRADGTRQCPVVVVETLLPRIHPGHWLWLPHSSVCTLFHEFGHALNEVLSHSKYYAFSGNNVTTDYLEVPSELLEQWAWDEHALALVTHQNSFPWKNLYSFEIEELKASRLADVALDYQNRMAWALTDLALNTELDKGVDCIRLSNAVLAKNYLPVPVGAAPATAFLYFVSYDSGVYSHTWCEAVAEDLLTEFHKAPGGLLDPTVGMRLRHEIFETGSTRPSKESIKGFLGRPYSTEPFFERLGLSSDTQTANRIGP